MLYADGNVAAGGIINPKDNSVGVEKINDSLSQKEINARKARIKEVTKVVMWTDPSTAPILTTKLVAQKVLDKKNQQTNMTPQVQKILNDLQTSIGAKAGIPIEVMQSDDPPTAIKDMVVDGHSIDDAAHFLGHHHVFLKYDIASAFESESPEESSFANDTGASAQTSAPATLMDEMNQYFDDARRAAMKLAVQSRTKALATINQIQYAYKQHVENAEKLKKEASKQDLDEVKALLAGSDKKSIASSVNTLTVDSIKPKAAASSGSGQADSGVLWVYGAAISVAAFAFTAIYFIRKR